MNAARELFSSRGYNTVTMREIADKAGCSHTAIYMYYSNKMNLLQELAIDPLTSLLETLQTIQDESKNHPSAFIKSVSLKFVKFAFEHRSMYDLFFTTAGERVDKTNPEYKVNHIRIQLFDILKAAIRENVPDLTDEQALQHTRMFFYLLHGMIKTYLDNEETAEGMTDRLTAILNESIEVLLLGIHERQRELRL